MANYKDFFNDINNFIREKSIRSNQFNELITDPLKPPPEPKINQNLLPPTKDEPGYSGHIMKKLLGNVVLDVPMYCVKCRKRQICPEAEKVRMENGSGAVKGKCPDCGTGMYKIGGIDDNLPDYNMY